MNTRRHNPIPTNSPAAYRRNRAMSDQRIRGSHPAALYGEAQGTSRQFGEKMGADRQRDWVVFRHGGHGKPSREPEEPTCYYPPRPKSPESPRAAQLCRIRAPCQGRSKRRPPERREKEPLIRMKCRYLLPREFSTLNWPHPGARYLEPGF
jgi:hypothetical protein